MPIQPKIARSNRISISSATADIAIEYGARASLDELEFDAVKNLSLGADRFDEAGALRLPPSSVMPIRQLGQPVSVVNVIRTTPPQADETVAESPIVSIPTADLISHTSFKDGSKFVIRVIPRQGGKVSATDIVNQSRSDASLYFDRASLQSTAEIRDEKYAMFEGFDDYVIFLFGKRPKIWTFNFMVLNCKKLDIPLELEAEGRENDRREFIDQNNMDFTDELIRKWNKYYRGTAAIQGGYVVYMSYEDILIEATLLSMVVSRNNMAGVANVTITFAVHDESFIGDSLSFENDRTLSDALQADNVRSAEESQVTASSVEPPKSDLPAITQEKSMADEALRSAQDKASAVATELETIQRAMVESSASINALEQELGGIDQSSVENEIKARYLAEKIKQERGRLLQLEDAESAAKDESSKAVSALSDAQKNHFLNEIKFSSTSMGDTSRQQKTVRYMEVGNVLFDDPVFGESTGPVSIEIEVHKSYKPNEEVLIVPSDISGARNAPFDALDLIRGDTQDQRRKRFEDESRNRVIDINNYRLYDPEGGLIGAYFSKKPSEGGEVVHKSYVKIVHGHLEDNVGGS